MPISPSFNPFKQKQVKLPKTLHEMLKLALTDMKSILKNPNFKVNFSCWIDKNVSNHKKPLCLVCLGGSVLVGTLKLDENFDQECVNEFHKIEALDFLRKANLCQAYYQFYDKESKKDLDTLFGETISWKEEFEQEDIIISEDKVSQFNKKSLKFRQTAFFTYMEKLHTFLKSENV